MHARRQKGASGVEFLLAAPVLLLLGMGVLQWALLFHARHALEHAAFEAARAGSVSHALPEAIERGLAKGLLPYWGGAHAGQPHDAAVAGALAELKLALGAGWVAWRQIAPTRESFADWAEPALDARGEPMPGLLEIPNDNLVWRAETAMPASGMSGYRDREPIGRASAQTLLDANLLKLELTYGVPMTVPVIGRVAVWVMRVLDGCEAPSRKRLGPVDLGTPLPQAAPRAWACRFYLAPDARGRPVPRWPVRVAATIRMQTPARTAESLPARGESPLSGATQGPGSVGSPASFRPPSAGLAAGVGIDAAADGSAARRQGFLDFGSEREITPPGICEPAAP